MSDENNEATRVMSAPAQDRTMVANAPVFDRTMVAGGVAGATQMGISAVCPVCNTSNSTFETYCGDCGFLLASAPGTPEEAAPDSGSPLSLELVETSTNRRFKLKAGANIVGRENCDVLLMEGTVSRRHATITVENNVVNITDLGSTNGTQVEGARLSPNQPTVLGAGGTVKFGNTSLTLIGSGSAEATILAGSPNLVTVGEVPDALEDKTVVGEVAPDPAAESTPEPAAGEPSAAKSSVAQLLSTSGNATITISEGAQTIGRKSTNDVVIGNDPFVSGNHGLIVCDDDGIRVIDVGSTNGTTVNGQRITANTPQSLMNGDIVTFGKSEYNFEIIFAAPPPALVESIEAEPVVSENEEHVA